MKTRKSLPAQQFELLLSISKFLSLCNEIYVAEDTDSVYKKNRNKIKRLLEAVAQSDTRDIMVSYLSVLMCGIFALNHRVNPTELIQVLEGAIAQDEDGWACLCLLISALKEGMLGRRLAVLDQGLVAVLPKIAEAGDDVFVLFGCSIPVCLRKASGDDRWMLVGDCYVDCNESNSRKR